jgi:ATPase subunit of ABC transporter with duplicated ATPase domains
MITLQNVTLQLGKKPLFEDVNLKFQEGGCYGVIGANGAGKSTFLKLLSGELETSKGNVYYPSDKRLSFLRQDHHVYDEDFVIDCVIKGNTKLYETKVKREAIYLKEDFNEEDGIIAGELEALFDEMDGWNAESDAAILLSGLGVDVQYHDMQMKNLKAEDKVKVLLAQALFGNPDILLLDEPTNDLDIHAIRFLEEFLINFKNTIIVVSHDRHFLNKVCTHIADIDYGMIKLYAGNYDFWYETSELIKNQMKDANKKAEEKIKELQEFIARFSANASKSRQATSRKKALEKIEIQTLEPSSRRYPYINFKVERPLGTDILTIEDFSYVVDGKTLINNMNLVLGQEDKVAFIANNDLVTSALFKILNGTLEPTSGTYKFGETVRKSFFSKDIHFNKDLTVFDFLQQFSPNQEQTYVRSFLGRMLFSGEDALKKMGVLSGGERVRSMIAKMMIEAPNLLILDEPTNHLDMESITALNKGLIQFTGVILISSHDRELIQTTANRIIEIKDDGTVLDYKMTYDEYLDLKY